MMLRLPKYIIIAFLLVGTMGVYAGSSSPRYLNLTEESIPESLEENILIVNEQRYVTNKSVSKIATYPLGLHTPDSSTSCYITVIRTHLYLQFRSILI